MRKLKTLELKRLSEDDFKSSKKKPIILFLDDIRSMHNVGSAFRTADAFLIEKIILGGITATPPHNDIRKTALGAENTVDWEHTDDCVSKLEELKKEGYKIIAVEQAEGSTSLENYEREAEEKICLVFGNEVFGVADEIIAFSDMCLEIPQYGTKHSLNISVSLGIVVWQCL